MNNAELNSETRSIAHTYLQNYDQGNNLYPLVCRGPGSTLHSVEGQCLLPVESCTLPS